MPAAARIFVTTVVVSLFSIAATADTASNVEAQQLCFFGHCARPIAQKREDRFLGKVQPSMARRRGGERAVANASLPWVDWQTYYGTADRRSLVDGMWADFPLLGANSRGITGALIDLEYQRMELIKFNVFDNSGTYEEYVNDGATQRQWTAMRLRPDDPNYQNVGGDGVQQCRGALIRHRNLTGICNDIDNPAMGSTGMLFARNVQFESTYPELARNEYAVNRNGSRLDRLRPDPAVISRELFTRSSPTDHNCKADYSTDLYPNDEQPVDTVCDYQKASFFNVLAAFWIQFMTHDWFSHLVEGENEPGMYAKIGCMTKLVDGVERPLTSEEIARLGCRPDDRIDVSLMADRNDPSTFKASGREYLSRAYRTTRNMNTAWWDASQIYGYDERSRSRVKRDAKDRAKLAMIRFGNRSGSGEVQGYLPVFSDGDPIIAQWKGQEAAAFPDNWSIGMSFYTTLFAREHNLFVDAFRKLQATTPEADSGLRDPEKPAIIRYKDVTDEDLFEVARLVIAAEIAKIHTIEWTPQLLYDEPLFKAMNANWFGLFHRHDSLKRITAHLATDGESSGKTAIYSVFASGAGIFGLKNSDKHCFLFWCRDRWNLADPHYVNGGVNHFGSPFNFPEEFVTVYRLHPLVPDLIDYREWQNANAIRAKIAVASTVRGAATAEMENRGIANWALSMGRQRLGVLTLGNHPRFLQNLTMPRISQGARIDVLALDLVRDREHGVPRFNEFRRQYGLRQLTSYDQFIDPTVATKTDEKSRKEAAREQAFIAKMRSIYGQHKCDASKIITTAQKNADGAPINDCLGHPNGSMVDNIEDVDTIVGWLSEFRRPHGFAISETQFQVFILNASRRLFSDRFFTSSFRPEFYSTLGYEWVTNNGPGPTQFEPQWQNRHKVEVSPLKRVLMRTMPELEPELKHVVNAFDPWARDRGEYYSLEWKPRPDAKADPAFGVE